MSVEKNVPQIRFKGFNEEWTEKNLGEIGSLKNGMNFDKAAMGHGHPFVNLQDVFGKNEVNSENLGLAYSTENQRKDYSLNEGDVLFIRSSVKPEGVGEAAVVPKKLENTTYSGFIIRFRPGVEMDVNFNRFVYSTTNSRKQILASSTSSANSNINQDSLQRIQLALPCKPEQTRIGNHFQKLDNLINQHQQKHDKLSSIKKAMLEKMFPRQGETVPEIRFKGFGGEWEEVSLSDFGVATSGTSIESEFSTDGKYKVISIGSYSENSVYTDQGIRASLSAKTENRVLNKNDLAMILNDKTLAGNIIGRVLLINENDSYVYNQRTQRIEPFNEYDPQFLYQFLNAPLVRKKIFKSSQGNTQIYVNWSAISKLKYFIPKRDEQTVIGNYFQKLDTLINQHQQQITKLNNIKQACLSKMFV